MHKAFLGILLLWSCVDAFYDAALEQVWSSIEDIYHPTLEDYRRLEFYLHTQRDFLDIPRALAYEVRLNQMRNFNLVGPNGEMPIFEKYSFHMDADSKDRCILLFASYNGIYPDKAHKLLSELEERGYRGHVLLRIGGFPNMQNGGLKICHVPYSFKLAFLQEAKALGYKDVLWMDLAVHPLTNLELIFSEIDRKGYFFTSVGSLQDNAPGHRLEAAAVMDVSSDLYPQIPHISSCLLGLNMEHSRASRLLDHWYRETEKVYSCLSWFPEELSLSVVAWRLNWRPSAQFGTIVCLDHEVGWLWQQRPTLQMYLDGQR